MDVWDSRKTLTISWKIQFRKIFFKKSILSQFNTSQGRIYKTPSLQVLVNSENRNYHWDLSNLRLEFLSLFCWVWKTKKNSKIINFGHRPNCLRTPKSKMFLFWNLISRMKYDTGNEVFIKIKLIKSFNFTTCNKDVNLTFVDLNP